MKRAIAVVFAMIVAGCGESVDKDLYYPDSEKRSHNYINEDPDVDPFYVYEMYTNNGVQDIAKYYQSIDNKAEDFDIDPDQVFGVFNNDGVEYQLEVGTSYEKDYKYQISLYYYSD